jgi:hypothetical protein
VIEAGGVLDSPPAMRLATRFPLSPPATLPASVLALPATDEADYDSDDVYESPSPTLSEHSDDGSSESVVPFGDVEDATEPYDQGDQQRAGSHLLSPLSPEWETSGISEGPGKVDGTKHLADLPSPPSGSMFDELTPDNSPRSSDDDGPDDDFTTMAEHVSGPHFAAGTIPGAPLGGNHVGSLDSNDSFVGNEYMRSPPSPTLDVDIPSMSCPFPHLMDLLLDDPPETKTSFSDRSTDLHGLVSLFDRSMLSFTDIPHAHPNGLSSGLYSSHLDYPYDDRHDKPLGVEPSVVDLADSLFCASPPLDNRSSCDDCSASISSEGDFSASLFRSPPLTPSLTNSPLSPLDEDDIFPIASPAPSRRLIAELPPLDGADDLFSPSQTLLSLPGAETDDELIEFFPNDCVPESLSAPQPYPLTPAPGLLLMDDGDDFGSPRSPSPEDFDLDVDIDADKYPEFEQLCELRKKSLSLESAARERETQLWDRGLAHLRHEVRRMRKQEKERGNEIGALLRLNLGKESVGNLDDGRSSKKAIRDLPQLVAKMLFRRHETSRPLAQRRMMAGMAEVYTPSGLSRSVLTDLS